MKKAEAAFPCRRENRMKHLLLAVAAGALLGGCATYVPYDYAAPGAYPVTGSTGVYYPNYAYPYSYAYPYAYPYPYYGGYAYSPLWISGSWSYSSGGHHHHPSHGIRHPWRPRR